MSDDKEIILLNVSGEDRPGVTTSLTAILSEYDANILDIGQSVIHNTLSLGMLIEMPRQSSAVLKDLLFKAYKLGVRIKFTPVDVGDYRDWVDLQGKDRYIITLLGRKLTAEQISKVTSVIASQGLNIDFINRLTGRIPVDYVEENESKRACVELSVRGNPKDKDKMGADFLEISQKTGVDIAFQADNIYRRNRRLVCFDMDSTLIQAEVIVELAKAHNVGDEVHKITEEAMRGEIDFNESFKRRVGLLKGLDESVMKKIAENLPVTEGAATLISTLKKFGYKTAILSGGFTYFGKYLQKLLGIDYVYANELEIENGKLTGRHLGDIVDGKKKAELLKEIALKESIQLEQVIAVGDGANDLPMLGLAGLGVAFHAKPLVKKNAKHSISTIGLDGVLYLLGFRERDIKSL